jgi:ATP-dependent DNA ligase
VEVSERAADVLERLRPQAYAIVRPDRIGNPIVEPRWAGVRVLASVDDGSVAIRDEAGEPFVERPEIDRALAGAIRVDSAILDGWLTKQPTAEIAEALPAPDIPTAGQFVAKPFIGIRRDRAKEAEDERRLHVQAAIFAEDEPVAFVATDLLWLDGESLLDVPLLERKRLLESVISESALVRVGMFVRPPIETWVATWRRLGFFGLSFRGANSRYHPGEERDDWTTTSMPRR